MKTRADLAKLILEMNYGELMGVASSFASMKDEEVRPKVETPQEFAAMLFDWAEAEEYDNDKPTEITARLAAA